MKIVIFWVKDAVGEKIYNFTYNTVYYEYSPES